MEGIVPEVNHESYEDDSASFSEFMLDQLMDSDEEEEDEDLNTYSSYQTPPSTEYGSSSTDMLGISGGSSSPATSSSTDANDCTQEILVHYYSYVRRPRKKYERKVKPKLPLLRVLKSDIRRFYIHMLRNTLNSLDKELYRSFLSTYAVEFPVVHMYLSPPKEYMQYANEPPTVAKVVGLEPNVAFLEQTYLNNPDYVMIIEEPTLITKRGSTECRLVCNCTITATFMSPKWIDGMVEEGYKSLMPADSRAVAKTQEKVFTPFHVTVNGKLSILIDADKRMKFIELDASA